MRVRGPALARPWARILAAGAVLWLAHGWLVPPPREPIVVGEELRRGLRSDFRRRTGQAPSAAQEAALIEAYVDDEVLYREALALGLDKGDVVVRRRLVQNMGFLLEETNPLAEPTDAELHAHLARNAARFGLPEQLTLTHVFVAHRRDDRHDDRRDAEQIARELRARIAAGDDPARLGDPFPHGRHIAARTPRELDELFGAGFAARVATLPAGEWSQPMPSSFGSHLVRVAQHSAASLPALADVRAELTADWRRERRRELERSALARLRERYEVVRDAPAMATREANAAP